VPTFFAGSRRVSDRGGSRPRQGSRRRHLSPEVRNNEGEWGPSRVPPNAAGGGDWIDVLSNWNRL